MGEVIRSRSAQQVDLTGILRPIIYCNATEDTIDASVSLNHILAEKLLATHPKRRTMRLSFCFEDVLKTLPDEVIIKDFDVLFNPTYKVDVMKIMVDVCKRKPFSIIWPGKYEDGKLLYAEDGYPDFKTFSVEEYDITCII